MKLLKEINYKVKKMFSRHADKLEQEMICDHVRDEVAQMNQTLNQDVKTVAKFSLKIDEIDELIKQKKIALSNAKKAYEDILAEIKNAKNANSNIDEIKIRALVSLKNVSFIEKNIADLENTKQSFQNEYENMIAMLRSLKMKIVDKNLEAEKAISKYEINNLKKSVEHDFKLGSSAIVGNKSYLKKLNDSIKIEETENLINEKIGNKESSCLDIEVNDEELETRLNADIAIS